LLISSALHGQINSDKSADSLFGTYPSLLSKISGQEILLHTDRWLYRVGETIYFRAYCLNNVSGKLDRQSKLLFVDIVNANDEVVSSLFLNNDLLRTEGFINIPDTLAEGDYWIRSYTFRILRDDTGAIIVKHLYFVNPKNRRPASNRRGNNNRDSTNGEYLVSFLPEGGSIIEGTDQRMAFSIKDLDGKPVSISGYLKNEEDSIVARFSSPNSGFGMFRYFVQNDEKYVAHFGLKERPGTNYLLPFAETDGARLSLVKPSDTALVLFVALGNGLFRTDPKTFILGVNRGRIFFGSMGKSMYEVSVSKKDIPLGISDFLLFNEQKELISQRSVSLSSGIVTEVMADKSNYQAREKVKMDISILDEKKQPTIAILSLAVTNDKVAKQFSNDLDNSKEEYVLYAREKIYRKLKFIQIDTTKKAEAPFYLSGRVFNKNGKRVSLDGLIITLFCNQDRQDLYLGVDTTRSGGNFYFPFPEFADSRRFQIEVSNNKGVQQDVLIQLDTFRFPTIETPKELKLGFGDSSLAFIRHVIDDHLDTISSQDEKKMLAAVTVTAAKKESLTYDENKRVSKFSHIISREMIPHGVNGVENALFMVPGVSLISGYVVFKGPGGFGSSAQTEPLIVVDGNPQTLPDPDPSMGTGSPVLAYLRTLSPNDIEFIEAMSGPEAAFYGARSKNGVIIINTRKGERRLVEREKTGLPLYAAKGYLSMIPFPEPNYTSKERKKSPYPDHRSTIYWNGNIMTDVDGKAHIEFFTADEQATYMVTLYGVTINGDIFTKNILITRK